VPIRLRQMENSQLSVHCKPIQRLLSHFPYLFPLLLRTSSQIHSTSESLSWGLLEGQLPWLPGEVAVLASLPHTMWQLPFAFLLSVSQ
jgi:hypothetical protein